MEFTRRLRHFVSWHRRVLAAVLAGFGVLLLATQLAPAAPPGTDVVVTVRALSPGEVVGQSDVHVVALPPGSLPEADLPALGDVVGATVAVPVAANSTVQSGMLATAAEAAEGRALVPIAIADEQLVRLLGPGFRVSLVYAGEGFEVVTDDARVAALPAQEVGGPTISAGSGRAPLLLVDVPAQVAPTVAALGQRGELSVVLGRA